MCICAKSCITRVLDLERLQNQGHLLKGCVFPFSLLLEWGFRRSSGQCSAHEFNVLSITGLSMNLDLSYDVIAAQIALAYQLCYLQILGKFVIRFDFLRNEGDFGSWIS